MPARLLYAYRWRLATGTDSEIAAYCDQRYFRMVYYEHVTDDLAALQLKAPGLPYGLLPMRREASRTFRCVTLTFRHGTSDLRVSLE